jgi:hypothetical protein
MSRGTLSSDKTASALDAIELMTQKESGASVFTSLGRLVEIFTEREVFKIENLLKPVTGHVICQFQPKGEKRRERITRPQKFIQPLKKGGMRKWMTYINPDTFTPYRSSTQTLTAGFPKPVYFGTYGVHNNTNSSQAPMTVSRSSIRLKRMQSKWQRRGLMLNSQMT